MTAVAAVTAFPVEKVLTRGCAVLYAGITSTIACNSVSFFVLFCFVLGLFVVVVVFFGGWGRWGGVGGDVGVCLGFTRLRVNQV